MQNIGYYYITKQVILSARIKTFIITARLHPFRVAARSDNTRIREIFTVVSHSYAYKETELMVILSNYLYAAVNF